MDTHYGNFTKESGVKTTRKLFSQQVKPTALFAANNLIAVGALSVLRELELSVPDNVSLVSFDDIPENLTMIPFLTVVNQPSYEIGKSALNCFFPGSKRVRTPPKNGSEIIFPANSSTRRSSGKLPNMADMSLRSC